MARFSDLPNEILLMILEMLSPLDADVFCLLSKSIRAVAASFLRDHLPLKWGYTICRYLFHHTEGLEYPSAGLLRNLLYNPRLARYVRSLHVLRMDLDSVYYVEDSTLELYRKYIQDCAMISDDDKDALLVERLDRGNEEPAVVLLLLLLPNLVKLRLDHCCDRGFMTRILKKIGTSQENAVLAQLEVVELDACTIRHDARDDILTHLSLLPNLRRIAAHRVVDRGSGDDDYWSTLVDSPKSPVTHIQLANCFIQPDSLFRLFVGTGNLTSFSYCSDHAPDYDYESIMPEWLRAMLLSCAENTLRELTIFTWDDGYMGSLRGFKALEKVSTNLRLLHKPIPSDEPTWSRVLPRKLQSLKIQDAGGSAFDFHKRQYRYEAIRALLDIKYQEVPDLEWLHYQCNADLPFAPRNLLRPPKIRRIVKPDMATACAEVGIQLQIEWVSFRNGTKNKMRVAEVLEGSSLTNPSRRTL